MDARHPQPSGDLQHGSALAVFQSERPRLFRIAHRILGSVTETEDVMQDVWLRWQRSECQGIDNSSAFLATVTSRAAINVVQSARSRHEVTTASCLGDPMSIGSDPTTRIERTETAELIVQVLLERTNPAERAAYLLRRGFDYPYRNIAQILHLGVANTRQLVRRAHVGIHAAGPVARGGHAHPRLVRAFVAAAHDGDFAELEAVLVADIQRRRKPPGASGRTAGRTAKHLAVLPAIGVQRGVISAPRRGPERSLRRGD